MPSYSGVSDKLRTQQPMETGTIHPVMQHHISHRARHCRLEIVTTLFSSWGYVTGEFSSLSVMKQCYEYPTLDLIFFVVIKKM